MYSEKDLNDINKRLRFYVIILFVVLAALIAVFTIGCMKRYMWLTMIDGALIWAACVFMFDLFIIPVWRYRRFLKEMDTGLEREVAGTLLGVDDAEDYQDGVRVLPVHIKLRDEDDTRILYINVSKRDALPQTGSEVRFDCYGRHIRGVNC